MVWWNFVFLEHDFTLISGKFGLTLNSDLSSGTSSGNIDTFHTIQLTPSTQFDIDHVEVRKFCKLAYIYELHNLCQCPQKYFLNYNLAWQNLIPCLLYLIAFSGSKIPLEILYWCGGFCQVLQHCCPNFKLCSDLVVLPLS